MTKGSERLHLGQVESWEKLSELFSATSTLQKKPHFVVIERQTKKLEGNKNWSFCGDIRSQTHTPGYIIVEF